MASTALLPAATATPYEILIQAYDPFTGDVVNGEFMIVTGVSGNVLTVTRGVQESTPAAYTPSLTEVYYVFLVTPGPTTVTSATATTITVTSAAGYPTSGLFTPFTITVGSETMLVTAVNGNNLHRDSRH